MTEYFQWENENGPNALDFKPKIFGFIGKSAHTDKLLTYFNCFSFQCVIYQNIQWENFEERIHVKGSKYVVAVIY